MILLTFEEYLVKAIQMMKDNDLRGAYNTIQDALKLDTINEKGVDTVDPVDRAAAHLVMAEIARNQQITIPALANFLNTFVSLRDNWFNSAHFSEPDDPSVSDDPINAEKADRSAQDERRMAKVLRAISIFEFEENEMPPKLLEDSEDDGTSAHSDPVLLEKEPDISLSDSSQSDEYSKFSILSDALSLSDPEEFGGLDVLDVIADVFPKNLKQQNSVEAVSVTRSKVRKGHRPRSRSLPMILDEARAIFSRTLSFAEPVDEYNADIDDFFRPAMESEGTTALSRQALESRGTALRRPIDALLDDNSITAARDTAAMPTFSSKKHVRSRTVPVAAMLPKSDEESVDEEDDEYEEYRRRGVRGPVGEGSIYEDDWDVYVEEVGGNGDADGNFKEEDFDDGDVWICHSKAL